MVNGHMPSGEKIGVLLCFGVRFGAVECASLQAGNSQPTAGSLPWHSDDYLDAHSHHTVQFFLRHKAIASVAQLCFAYARHGGCDFLSLHVCRQRLRSHVCQVPCF
jgi:hypothetical protein